MHIFFSVDNRFVPYLSVMLASMLEHAHGENRYVLHILHRDLSKDNREALKIQIAMDKRFSIDFVDVSDYLKGREFYTESRKDLNQSTYYRLMIPYIFPELDKAFYLDGDMVALTDIARLDLIKLDNKLLAAVRDYQGIADVYCPETEEKYYIRDTLGIENPDELIIAGLLILNLKEFRRCWSMEELLELAESREWKHHDQDILNVLSAGNKKILDAKWNILPDIGIYKYLPEELYNEWKNGSKCPYVVHFGGDRKPWKYPNIPYAHLFWKYAKFTLYNREIRAIRRKEFLHDDEFRKIYIEQLIVPYGSLRRAGVRKIWKSIRLLRRGATEV